MTSCWEGRGGTLSSTAKKDTLAPEEALRARTSCSPVAQFRCWSTDNGPEILI